MKKYSGLTLILLVTILALFSCRPPEVEGLIVRINQQLYDDETYRLAEEAVSTNPGNAEAWYYYGWLYGKKGDFEKMNMAFDKCLELNPEQPVKSDAGNIPAKVAIKNLRAAYFAENHNAGVAAYKKAFETDDETARKELLEKARDKFIAARKASPDRKEPIPPLTSTLLQLGDTTAAENVFLDAMKKGLVDDTLILNAADFYLVIKRTDKAEEMYKKVLEHNPKNGDAYLGLGQIETNKGNWEKARQYFEKALEIDPENSNVAFNIGVSFYNQEKYAEAIPYLRKTLEAEPDNKSIYEILGVCYVQSEKYDEGLPFLEDAVERYPDDASLWNYLAIVYANKGMKDKAEEAMKKTKELEGM